MNSTTFDGLREILIKDYALAPESLTPATALEDLQIDSLAQIELIFAAEDRFHVTAQDTPETFKTLGDVAAYIDGLIDQRAAGGPTAEQRG